MQFCISGVLMQFCISGVLMTRHDRSWPELKGVTIVPVCSINNTCKCTIGAA